VLVVVVLLDEVELDEVELVVVGDRRRTALLGTAPLRSSSL
jgi:hypothetical protein